MRRREFIAALGGVAAWPLAGRAQQPGRPVIGHMHATSEAANRENVAALVQGLGETGYLDGQNIAIEYRWADGRYDRLPEIAAELVTRRVAVIVAGTPVAARAAKQATPSIPIVFYIGSDPIKDGLVSVLNHPGGNITGATFFGNLLNAKRTELLHELLPNAQLFGFLVNSGNMNAEFETSEVQRAAAAHGVQVLLVQASAEHEIERAIADAARRGAKALMVAGDAFLNNHNEHIANTSLQYRIPTCFTIPAYARSRGLMSYGASNIESVRHAGNYAGRILKGEKAGDLPVVQPTRFDFVINLKVAKALGIVVPPMLLARADEVIE